VIGRRFALECEIARWFNRYVLLNGHQDTGANQDLPGLASSQSRDATLDIVPIAA
jgi:hypothetical protein